MAESEEKQAACCACGKTDEQARRCAICNELFCPNCIVDIAGNDVCEGCKRTALSQIQSGEPVGPVTKSNIELPIKSERKIDGGSSIRRTIFNPFFTLFLLILAVSVVAFILATRFGSMVVFLLLTFVNIVFVFLALILLLSVREFPRNIYMDEENIKYQFKWKWKAFKWNEIKEVVFRKGILGQPEVIALEFRTRKTKKAEKLITLNIDSAFERFDDIAVFVWNKCRENAIPITES